ncbi:hypothetical protein CAE01nite_10580 [Cellulomonas aerilata]|uniref:Glycosyltransferase 2-like domain-containing protein n=1 Tax=Cellulomonas aerilata TaxID=515326 RepID=A0A512DA28_9CELL|nr:hypothetical protein CAE01nite_10580 [Cellulomonas aerilata]
MTAQLERPPAPAARFAPHDADAALGVLVVTHDNESHVDRLVESLRGEAGDVAMRVVVVDNDSSDGTLARTRAHPDVLTVPAPGNLGYAGGINLGLQHLDGVDAVLVLNADLVVEPGAVRALLRRLDRPQAGIVLPLLLDGDGTTSHSLRREPSVTRALGDAVLGRHLGDRPAWLSETVRDPACYTWPHPVDWGTGAAMLIRSDVVASVGSWDERFFLYSEETDYCRRARSAGWEVWFEPAARVRHEAGGSGRSPSLTALLQVNRVRYARKHCSWSAAAATLAVTAAASLARVRDPGHRSALEALLVPPRRESLPRARRARPPLPLAVPASDDVPAPDATAHASTAVRGAVIIPAHDEAAVIAHALAPIAGWAKAVGVEVVVVCNGCTDATADIARGFPGVRVLELAESSKPAALNAGDEAARAHPRMYVDADVRLEPAAVEATLRALSVGLWLAARPPAETDVTGASAAVRAYHRTRRGLASTGRALWGAGVYGLSEEGHARLGSFPTLLADDLWVDELFGPEEKVVVAAPPVRVAAPRTTRSLLAVLGRTYRGNAEIRALIGSTGRSSTRRTLIEVAGTMRSPGAVVDAVVYAALVTLARARRHGRSPRPWERDESTRA